MSNVKKMFLMSLTKNKNMKLTKQTHNNVMLSGVRGASGAGMFIIQQKAANKTMNAGIYESLTQESKLSKNPRSNLCCYTIVF